MHSNPFVVATLEDTASKARTVQQPGNIVALARVILPPNVAMHACMQIQDYNSCNFLFKQ